jgi:hypothetical protein
MLDFSISKHRRSAGMTYFIGDKSWKTIQRQDSQPDIPFRSRRQGIAPSHVTLFGRLAASSATKIQNHALSRAVRIADKRHRFQAVPVAAGQPGMLAH